jgi:hypothetical protein
MHRKRPYRFFNYFIPIFILVVSGVSFSQQNSANDQASVEGTVVSVSNNTLVVKTDENDYRLFVLDRDTQKTGTLARGSRVRVESSPADREGARQASSVTVLSAASDSNANTNANATATQAVRPPQDVRDLEQTIKSEARRWHLGVRAGGALDPELFLFGVHSQIGPVFSRNVFFRPNAEFAFGEITDLIALNLEAIYRLPIAARGRTWSAYFGAGPSFTFLHQNFEREQGQGRDIDFGNFDYDTGFNLLAGIQRRHTFFEMKTSLYSRPAPTVRLIIGYTF